MAISALACTVVSGERQRVLIVGAGSIGERHLRCFLATNRAEVAFVEVRPELRDEVAGRYAQARPFADMEQAVEAFAPGAAVIATPAPLHVPQAIALAQRGVNLLIEKPLAVSLEGVGRLAEIVHREQLVAGVAYVYRAHPALAATREAVASGRFGKPVELVAVCGQNFPHYRPAYREIYYARHPSGGGAVQDALTHVINAGEWLAGPVTELAADTGHQVLEGVEVEDTAHVLTRQGDVMGSYSLNQHQAPNETTITVVCERGTARFEMHQSRWSWMTEPQTAWHEEACAAPERDALFMRQAGAFLDAIETGASPACSLAEGIQTLKVNVAILESSRRRRWEAVS